MADGTWGLIAGAWVRLGGSVSKRPEENLRASFGSKDLIRDIT